MAARNADKLETLAADKGYDLAAFRTQLRDADVRPLVKHRLYCPIDQTHNARLDDHYNQRSLCETVNSVVKRSILVAVRSRRWYRQFREAILAASIYNVERAVKS